jgi:hypothetical protein
MAIKATLSDIAVPTKKEVDAGGLPAHLETGGDKSDTSGYLNTR